MNYINDKYNLLCLNKLFSLLVLTICFYATEAFSEKLPSPLSLATALSFSDSDHPDLYLADAKLAIATAKKLEAETKNNVDAYIEIAPFSSYPSLEDEFVNDSYARLSLTKTLYDFGYNNHLEDSAGEAVSSQEFIASNSRNQNYLKIMQSFFDVILSDLHYAAVDEKMTSIYVQFNKLRERQSLSITSEVTVAEAESAYRKVADLRKAAQMELQSSRQRLAIALNRPDDIPYDLIMPDLPQLERKIPDINVLLESAYKNNLMLTALEHAIRADKAALKAAKHQFGPTLAAGLEVNNYARETAGRNDASIGVKLHIPILNGSKEKAQSARAIAELSISQAKYDQAKYSLRQQLSDLVRRLEILHYKRVTDQKRLNSTALALEKSRAIYELEIQTSLGSSMAEYTEAEWLSAKNNFDIVTTWTQIDMLTGQKLYLNEAK